ncbi:hypothetical protein M885DRAFT_615909 [Pelagophyceae sp. CCMP2097]|nr:hypothetical protein M885DRAFT_615909 [Pelagophyceae sp. CCMP2097]
MLCRVVVLALASASCAALSTSQRRFHRSAPRASAATDSREAPEQQTLAEFNVEYLEAAFRRAAVSKAAKAVHGPQLQLAYDPWNPSVNKAAESVHGPQSQPAYDPWNPFQQPPKAKV